MEKNNCEICGGLVKKQDPEDLGFCDPCMRRYPKSLRKAHCDPFQYAVGLTNGQIYEFESAVISGDFVELNGVQGKGLPFCFERGIDVFISSIAWCADAPNGS